MQDYPNIEIILVDDGSPDHCPALCDWYAEHFFNVRVIHQKNQGLGLSRNTGVKNASGEYIFFLDSDDCIDGKKAIRTLLKQAEEKKADIVTGSFRRFSDKMISKVNFIIYGMETTQKPWISALRAFICMATLPITGENCTGEAF